MKKGCLLLNRYQQAAIIDRFLSEYYGTHLTCDMVDPGKPDVICTAIDSCGMTPKDYWQPHVVF